MERLTLIEAAERLGVSKEAVRQQVDNGSIPHGKWPDGGVYVCMNAKADVKKDVRKAQREPHHKSRIRD